MHRLASSISAKVVFTVQPLVSPTTINLPKKNCQKVWNGVSMGACVKHCNCTELRFARAHHIGFCRPTLQPHWPHTPQKCGAVMSSWAFKHYSEHSVELARQRNEGKYLGKRVTLCEWETNAFTGFIALNCSMRKDKGKEKEE